MTTVTIDVEQLRGLVEDLAEAAVSAAINRARDDLPMFTQISAVVDAVDGASAYVFPDDGSTEPIEATRMHPDIVAGSTVWLVQTPPAGAFVLGPIP
jgi:hypothetical protein